MKTFSQQPRQPKIRALFLDVGGVLLTNGWDHHARRRAAKHFKLDWAEMEDSAWLELRNPRGGKDDFRGVSKSGGLL